MLPDPVQRLASSGDMVAELVALLTLASRSDRDAARKAERAEDMIRTQQEQQKVAKMHEQADDIRGAAWASGLAEIGQGACEVGVAFTRPVDGKFDWNDGFKAGDPAFKAGGELVSGQFKASEKLDSADAEEADAHANRAGRAAKEASDDVDRAREALKKISSFYEQMLQAQTGTVNAALNWRA
ncbi:MAG TPA: hypothetical protein VER96_40770 [Polyangiaceae bacterium]|nr:hypothetical protein [Polyangiaceae bacterium]